ncbi:hypothetical protein [Cecembia lonarensis]|uniref:hypothetical protein n=1 Tax=Cecembia lonarensis TaxID=645110 RepID=UPI0012F9E22E|nr:hypothetical protein [Cecembia lonarensis]
MKKIIHSCFLAFLCLYRSKSYGIRKPIVDHPNGSRAGNLSLKDGSRHVCMPSYLKPREFP